MNHANWIADLQPARKVVVTDHNGNHTTMNGCNLHFGPDTGFLIYSPSQHVDLVLTRDDILSISRHECSQSRGVRILLKAIRLDRAAVEITMPSSSSALSLLHSIDVAWPDVRLEYCDCTAVAMATCARAANDARDRLEWPSAKLTLIEWNNKGRLEIECVETDVVAMDRFYVFHLSGKHKPLLIRRAEILSPPVPLSSPFVGTKLHLSSGKYAYAKVEITNRADLPQFMNTMLFPWGEQTTLKRAHSDEDYSELSKELMDAASALMNIPLPPPAKRACVCNDFLVLNSAEATFTAIYVLSRLTSKLTFTFSISSGFIESGEKVNISVVRMTPIRYTGTYRLEFARAPAGFPDAMDAFKGVLPVGSFIFNAKAV